MIRALLENKAGVNDRDSEGATPLHYAIRFDNGAVSNEASVLCLLENGADIEAHEPVYGTALTRAAHFNDERMIRLLVRKRADVNAAGGQWGTVLEAAVDFVQFEKDTVNKPIVRFLLENGADASHLNEEASSELRKAAAAAASAGDETLVQLLVQRGAKNMGPDAPSELAREAEMETMVTRAFHGEYA